MWKLICYEWKKLAKSRSNLLLFVVLLAACAYQIKTNVTTDIKDYYFVSDEHLDVVKEQQNFANKSFEELQNRWAPSITMRLIKSIIILVVLWMKII